MCHWLKYNKQREKSNLRFFFCPCPVFLLNGVVKCVLEWECCARTMALLQLRNSIEHDSCLSALSITPNSCIPQPHLTGQIFQVWNKPMQANPAFQVPAFAWHHLFLLQRLQQAYSGWCPSNFISWEELSGDSRIPNSMGDSLTEWMFCSK